MDGSGGNGAETLTPVLYPHPFSDERVAQARCVSFAHVSCRPAHRWGRQGAQCPLRNHYLTILGSSSSSITQDSEENSYWIPCFGSLLPNYRESI